MSGKPLNGALYAALKRSFGAVKVVNPGERMAASVVTIENRRRLQFTHKGEYYRICCPFCRDTRFRLYVNHMFGKRDETGRKMSFLAECFNEHCLNREENRESFIARVDDMGFLEKAVVLPGKDKPVQEVFDWPGPCQSVAKLPADHPAVEYLTNDRDFDVKTLAHYYDVRYCSSSDYRFAEDRIIIPVFDGDKLRGWQARYIGELPWKDSSRRGLYPPKYYTCPGCHIRSQFIYNFDRMKEWETGILVEGPMDVWRFGLMAGCIFGNSVTQFQRRKLFSEFFKRTLVLLLDPEEAKSKTTLETISEFEKKMPGRFCFVDLPAGSDPGSLDRAFLRAYVKDQAAKRGVTVRYRRKLCPAVK